MVQTLALLIACALFSGCSHLKVDSTETATGKRRLRNNSCSLLYEMFNQEKNVSKLLLIKAERPEVNKLIKDISAAAGAGATKLEQLAKQDPGLNIHVPALPPGERAARDSISKALTGELLRATGDDFELRLLLTQIEALHYSTHLAQVAAANEPQPSRTREFTTLGEEMHRLYQQVVALLRSRMPPLNRDKAVKR